MIYMKHNLYKNYMSADGSGDNKMKRDILLSEIAKIIVLKPWLVRNHLLTEGFKVSNNPSRSELVNAVSNAMYAKPKFAYRMACEILSGNFSADGGGEIAPTMPGGGGMAEPAGNVVIAPNTAPAQPAPTPTAVVSPTPMAAPATNTGTVANVTQPPPNITVNFTQPIPQAPVNPAPIVNGFGGVFGGSGGGGGGGGDEAARDAAQEELAKKAAAMAPNSKLKKVLKWSFFIVVVAGITAGVYNYNKK